MALPSLAELAPGKMTALFLVVGAVTAVALAWMGVRLLEQDRALETQRLEERRDAVADRVVAGLEQALLAEERGLVAAPTQPAGEDALVVTAGPAEFHVRPERSILYYPMVPHAHDASPELFAAAEQFEFRDHNYEGAIAAFRALSASRDPAVKAGAQLRLARNLRKAGHTDAALGVYAELGESDATVTAVPASLIARHARCALLEGLGRKDQLRAEARELRDCLSGGHWCLDRDTYLYYSSQAMGWSGSNSASSQGNMALTRAIQWLWQNWQPSAGAEVDSAGRRSLRFDGTPVAVLWRASGGRLTGLVAGPRYQRQQWFDPVLGDTGFAGLRISLRDTGGALIFGEGPRPNFPQRHVPLRPLRFHGTSS